MNDLESRIAESLHHAGDRDDFPEPDLADVFRRTRQRSNARRVIGATVAVVLLTAGGFILVSRDDRSSQRINTGTTPSTVLPSVPAGRPVLDGCTTTSARTAVGGASWFNPVPAEVFADPARGVSGPLVVFERGGGALLPTGDGNAAGGKIANAQVNGRDADVEFYGTYGGVNWDASSGGSALLEQQGLTEDEMRAVAEQLDAGTAALPQGLVSLGMTDTVTVSTSDCHNQQGQSASITEIRGDQASRYSEVFSTAPRNVTTRQFDQDDATFVIVTGNAGALDIANATYHEATPEEWETICLGAGSSCDGKPPTTTTVP
jgi:hypothetical protein